MSKLRMLKFEAAALQNRGKDLIEQLQRLGAVSLEKVSDKRLFENGVSDNAYMYEKNMDVVDNAMEILKDYGGNYSGGMFSGRKQLSDEEYRKLYSTVQDTLAASHEIVKLKKLLSDTLSEKSRCTVLLDSLKIWQNLDIPLNNTTTESSSLFVGTFPVEYTKESLDLLFAEKLPGICEVATEVLYTSKEITSAVVICHKSCEKEISAFLRSLYFTAPVESPDDLSVNERIAKLEIEISDLEMCVSNTVLKLKEFAFDTEPFKFAYDYFLVKKDEYSALSDVRYSDMTLYITGFVPEGAAGKLSKVIEKNEGVIVYSEPSEEDDVPVLLSNDAFSEPVESIVEMYSLPGKNDIDPSKAMAFFYYLLFGMMLSDAGYGLLLLLGSLLILKFTSVEGGMRKMLKMFVYCGISTVFWGALFGSWFGDAIPVICREFFGIENPPSVALWFDPISDPITLLMFSFVIGICHLFLGLILFGYMKWNDGDKVGALCDTIPIMLAVTGAAPLAAGILIPVPEIVTSIASYVAIVGVVLIVLTSSRSGNIFVRFGGGVYALYNIASGYLSDILSYSRLLALGLATGSIGSVVNMLAVMVDVPGVKVVVFILVFILGHTLNMAINVLGAYVHTNRLQFVELFSKF